MLLHISAEEPPTEVKDTESRMAGVCSKWDENGTAFKAELKTSIWKVILTSYSVKGSDILLLIGSGELEECLFSLLSLIHYSTFNYSCNQLCFKTSWT